MGARAQGQRAVSRPDQPVEKPARRGRGRRGRPKRTRGFRLRPDPGQRRFRRRGLHSGVLRRSLGCNIVGWLGRLLGPERRVLQGANELVLPATQLDVDGAIGWTITKLQL